MANGLLDFFGKDYEDPRTQGLLQFGLGLMQAGGYQDSPVSLGQAIGAGGRQGMQAYQQAVAQKQKKEQLAQAKRLQDLQAKQAQQSILTSQQALKEKEAQQLAMSRFQTAQKMGFRDMAGNPMSQSQVDALAVAAYPELGSYRARKQIDKEFTPVTKEYGTIAFGDTLYETINGQLGEALKTKPPEEPSRGDFVTFVDPKDGTQKVVREDSDEADDLAKQGFSIIEGKQAVGGVSELVGMTKPVVNTIAQDLINNLNFIDQASALKTSYRPEFLTRFGQIKNIAFSELERLAPEWLTDENRQYLADYTDFATQAYGMVNDYIKSITGAAMSVEEAKRILKAIPNIDEMSPTQFVSALNKVIEEAQLAKARNIYMLENGIVPKKGKTNVFDETLDIEVEQDYFYQVSLKRMGQIMENEADKKAKAYMKDGNMSEADAYEKAILETEQKYGMSNDVYLPQFGGKA